MAVRNKDDIQAFCGKARRMFFSNATIDSFLDTASAAQLRAVSDFVSAELDNRDRARHDRLMRMAKFEEPGSFEGYDFSNVRFPDGYDAAQMRSLEFLAAKQDFVFHGPTGRGKTRCATALGIEAVDAGHEVRFFTVSRLVLHLEKLKADGKLLAFLNKLADAEMVILDEFGYVPIDIDGARLLYQVVTESLKGASLVITTNIEFGKWGAVLGDAMMAAAIVDRLVEKGRLVEFGGPSHRMEHGLMLGKAGER